MTIPVSPVPRASQPLFNVPGVVLGLIALMGLVHLARDWLSEEADFQLLADFAFVPARITSFFDPAAVTNALTTIASGGPNGAEDAQVYQFLMGQGQLRPWTLLSYSFLHADLTHLGLNCFWLLAFGSAVARRFGGLRFALFFAATAIAGALAHWLAHPLGFAPVIGASAAVSGAMAGAARFAFQPGGPLQGFGRGRDASVFQLPALRLFQVFTDRRVLPFVGIWFIINIVTGIGAVPLGLSDSSIAWEAHIGGFIAGLALFDLFDPYSRKIAA